MDYNRASSIQKEIDELNELIDEKTSEWDNLVNNTDI